MLFQHDLVLTFLSLLTGEYGREFVRSVGCVPEDHGEVLECLRRVPLHRIMDATR